MTIFLETEEQKKFGDWKAEYKPEVNQLYYLEQDLVLGGLCRVGNKEF